MEHSAAGCKPPSHVFSVTSFLQYRLHVVTEENTLSFYMLLRSFMVNFRFAASSGFTFKPKQLFFPVWNDEVHVWRHSQHCVDEEVSRAGRVT